MNSLEAYLKDRDDIPNHESILFIHNQDIELLKKAINSFNAALENATKLLSTDCNEDAYSEWVDKTDFADIWSFLPYAETELIDAVQRINNGEE